MPTPDLNFDSQLGPFYMEHSEPIEIMGFEESVDRISETLGVYQVHSNDPALAGEFAITHYDLTLYIQEDFDRLMASADAAPADREGKGFCLNAKSPSHAAGRAAEEVLLAKILWRIAPGDAEVLSFSDAQARKLVVRPKGIGSDDLVVALPDGAVILVESKASFRLGANPNRYIPKAVAQLKASLLVNPHAVGVVLSLIDLQRRTVVLIRLDRETVLSLEATGAFQAELSRVR